MPAIGNAIGIPFRKGGTSWSPYWVTRYISALSVLTTSDTEQTVTATIAGGVGPDGVSFEYSDDDGATWSAAITDADGILNQTGLTADTDYTWRARLYKGANYGSYVTAESNRTYGVDFAILDTVTAGVYNTISSLSQNPLDSNKVIMTYLLKDSVNYADTDSIIIRTSNDKGRTFGIASTAYSPGVNLGAQEQHAGYTSDGRFHILCTTLSNTGACGLIYLYSDNDGVSFIEEDISALVSDATYTIYRNSGKLVENNGILLSGFYSRNATPDTYRRLCLRLVAGTWTKVTVDTTVAAETETCLEVLEGNNIIMMVRDDAGTLKSFIQYLSTDNGLTWTRLGVAVFGLAAAFGGLPGHLNSFQLSGRRIIVMYIPYNNNTIQPFYSIYGSASDLLTFGINGWVIASLKTIVADPLSTFGNKYLIHGGVLHYNNDYNAIACIPSIKSNFSEADIRTFEIDTTDFATLINYVITPIAFDDTYAVDVDSNAFNIVNNTNPSAVNNLVGGLKSFNLWTKIKAAYPFIGNTATLHKWNLVNPNDSDAAFRLTFSGTWTHAVTGATPNGIDAFADTHLNPTSHLTLYSAGLGYYSRTNVSEAGIDIGAFHILGTTNPSFMMRVRYTDGKAIYYCYNAYLGTGNPISGVVADSRGFTFGSRTANNVAKIYINGLQSGATNTTATLNVTANFTMYIGADNTDGTAANFVTKECAFAIISDGLTDAEVKNLFRIVHYFQVALSRNV